MRFTYYCGQRPLDGFTIKRGIGKGAFGEVYLALSDGGKEVALKFVKDNTQAELRGVAHCLNLKHPNLVWLYDLRVDSLGNHWVVMEYVSGESLSTLIGRHPTGLPLPQVRSLFLDTARAVAYLHDRGVVHRDLKPGNVLVEYGVAKVGDHGLAKTIGGSQGHAQTRAVGTVYYMAPEISSGNYNRQIDVYSVGVILYEMLTGMVPFDGQSPGEIMMKHLTNSADLQKLPAEWRTIVGKALAKDTKDRYASMEELIIAVEAIGQAPASFPSGEMARGNSATSVVQDTDTSRRGKEGSLHSPIGPVGSFVSVQSWIELSGSLVGAALFAGLVTLLLVPLGGTFLFTLFFVTLVASWAVLLPSKWWRDDTPELWTRRVVMLGLGGLVGGMACWVDGRSNGPMTDIAAYLCYYALVFASLPWWEMTHPRREQRFAVWPVVLGGLVGGGVLVLLRPAHPYGPVLAVGIVVLTVIIVQLVSPYEPPRPRSTARAPIRYV